MATRIQLRGDIAANWITANPILAEREMAIETDTNLIKIGDGVTVWELLPYTLIETISYQVDSATFPINPNVGDWLFVTDTGNNAGDILEKWIFDGNIWKEVQQLNHETISYQPNSATFPIDPINGDWLFVTDTGNNTGIIQEKWIFDGSIWKQTSTGEHWDDYTPITRSVSTQHSIIGGGNLAHDRLLSLVNDVASPGANKVYGTDAGGNRGWKDDPAGGGGGPAPTITHMVNSIPDIQNNTNGNWVPIKLFELGQLSNLKGFAFDLKMRRDNNNVGIQVYITKSDGTGRIDIFNDTIFNDSYIPIVRSLIPVFSNVISIPPVTALSDLVPASSTITPTYDIYATYRFWVAVNSYWGGSVVFRSIHVQLFH